MDSITLESKKEPKITTIVNSIKISYFNLVYLLIKNHSGSFYLNIFSTTLQFLQLIAYSYSPSYLGTWTYEHYPKISRYMSYFQVIPIFEGNHLLFVIFFFFCAFYVIFLFSFIIYFSYQLSKLKINSKAAVYFLGSIFSFNSTFYLIVIRMLLSLFNCSNGTNYYSTDLKCFSGLHIPLSALSLLCLIIYFTMSLVIDITYFEYRNIKGSSSCKMTTITTIQFLIVKTIFGVMYELLDSEIILSFIALGLSFYLLFHYNLYQPYHNHSVNTINLILEFCLFWSNLILFIGNLFDESAYKGGIFLMLIGYPIIAVGINCKDHSYFLKQLLLRDNLVKEPFMLYKKIKLFIQLIEHNDTDLFRRDCIYLLGFVKYLEQFCPHASCGCPLRQFIKETEKKIDRIKDANDSLIEKEPVKKDFSSLLYQHGEWMYKRAISRFPRYTKLKISYGVFLYEKLHRKQRGLVILNSIKKEDMTLEDEFTIYRCKKLLEEEMEGELSAEGLDYVSALAYKGYVNNFKQNIIKVSLLYTDFWNVLFMTDSNSKSENFEKMSELGGKISKLVINIKTLFNKIQQINKNEIEVVRLYSQFLTEILNEESAGEVYSKKVNELEDRRHKYDENNIFNLNFKSLSRSEDYKYIIVSANTENFGRITNISLSACIMFGYGREELVGQDLGIIIPEIMAEQHSELLQKKFDKYKKENLTNEETEKVRKNKKYNSFVTYGKNKSKYLVQTKLRVGIVSTEEGEIFFVSQILKDYTDKDPVDNTSCFILTDSDLMIQNFTSNAVKMLGLNSTSINSTVEVTDYIKEFNEEFLRYMINAEDSNLGNLKKNTKVKIINKKYRIPKEITWIPTEAVGGEEARYDFSSLKWKSSRFAGKPGPIPRLSSGNVIFGKDEVHEQDNCENPKSPEASIIQQRTHKHFTPGTQIGKPIQTDAKNNFLGLYGSGIPDQGSSSMFKPLLAKKDEKFYLTVDDIIIKNEQVGYLFHFEALSLYSQKKMNCASLISLLKKPSRNLDLEASKKKKIQIDENFVPDISLKENVLCFDVQNLSFKPQKLGASKIGQKLKEIAYKKVKTFLDKKNGVESEAEESEYTSSDYDSEEYDDEEYEYSNSHSSSREKEKEKEKANEKFQTLIQSLETANKTKPNERSEDYYRVKLDKVQLYEYNYIKGIAERSKKPIISEMEDRLKIKPRTQDKEEEKNNDDKKPSNSQSTTSTKNVTKDNEKVFQKNEKFLLEQEERQLPQYTEKDFLVSQIKRALNNKSPQPTVVNLAMITAFLFLTLMAVSTVIYIMFSNCKSTVMKFLTLIIQALGFERNLIYSLSAVREIILLSYDMYAATYGATATAYMHQMENEVEEYFKQNYVILEELSSTFNSLGESDIETVESTKIYISALDIDGKLRNYSLSTFPALIENNMALYHITQTPQKERNSKEKNTFYFLHNSLNDIISTAFETSEFFSLRFVEETKKLKEELIISSVVILVYFVCAYFIFIHFYSQVELRKQSYLQAFYEIGSTFIATSLVKCEKFSQRVQIESVDHGESVDASSCSSSDEVNELLTIHHSTNAGISKPKEDSAEILKTKSKHLHQKKKMTKPNNLRNKLIFLLVMGIFCIYSIVVLVYNIYLIFVFENLAKYVYYSGKYQDAHLFYFVTIRELIYDPNRTILNLPIKQYLEKKSSTIYQEMEEGNILVHKYIQYMPKKHQEFYQKIFKRNLCDYSKEFFESNDILGSMADTEEMQKIVCNGMLYKTLGFGLQSLYTTYNEDLRAMKNYFFNYQTTLVELGLAKDGELFGIEEVRDEILKNDGNKDLWIQYNPLYLFVTQTHRYLLLTFSLFLRETFKFLRDDMQESLQDYYDFNCTIMYISIPVLFAIEILSFLFGLLPFEISLNDTIYKTKNMLSIIPKDVLATLNQIRIMLDIDSKKKKGKKKPNQVKLQKS